MRACRCVTAAGPLTPDPEARFTFDCAQAQVLGGLDIGLFDAFKHLQRLDVQVAGPKGRAKHTLRRPARSVPLAR